MFSIAFLSFPFSLFGVAVAAIAGDGGKLVMGIAIFLPFFLSFSPINLYDSVTHSHKQSSEISGKTEKHTYIHT